MSDVLRKILSPAKAGPLIQFVKYGVVGVLATLVQTAVFYVLAATALKCLAADDFAVKYLGLTAVDVSQGVRAVRFAVATSIGFVVANVFCWLMNRAFVFRAGKFKWWKEFGLFIGVSGLAMAVATGIGSVLINSFGLMTTLAVFVEIAVSFMFNYFLRKFFIFRG